jgi:DNA-binding MarR family transcriptional regulator
MQLNDLTMYKACLLHSKSERVLKGLVSKTLDDWDLNRMQWLLLATSDTPSNHPLGHTMSELADILDIKMSQVTALMSSMVEAKLISQQVSNEDRRTRYVKTTRRGKKLLEEIEKGLRKAMRQWLGEIPRDQLAIYMKTVQELGSI